MTGLAQLERRSLCSTLTRVGPHAPTLCDGWDTSDLAAHLVVRERRPDAAAGVVIPALADRTARVQDTYAEQAWPGLVDMVRQGPPGWSPVRVPAVDDAVNLVEFYVHHEDVLRAQPDEPRRALDADVQAALWSRLRQMGQLMFRRSPVGIVLVTPEHGRKAVRGPTKLGTVVLRGEPGELVLYGFGRGAVAAVEVEGEPDAVAALQETRLGL
ncbi:TIGR03085 family metal-binding protein [Agilicoccus flavus]|uniref:TIGR03085 family metal-binding protein n=1 Tax=Agilicoccus flavus TaxID=2775968 RepID=UPI001CF6E495|nr:TIGR03085 family metal-binding protein [Agilicoccus flavus]